MLVFRAKLISQADAILFMSGDRNYTTIHFASRPTVLYSVTLSDLESSSFPGFIRIHKSYLINPRYITECQFKPITQATVLVGGHWLPVSRRRVRTVAKRLSEEKRESQ